MTGGSEITPDAAEFLLYQTDADGLRALIRLMIPWLAYLNHRSDVECWGVTT